MFDFRTPGGGSKSLYTCIQKTGGPSLTKNREFERGGPQSGHGRIPGCIRNPSNPCGTRLLCCTTEGITLDRMAYFVTIVYQNPCIFFAFFAAFPPVSAQYEKQRTKCARIVRNMLILSIFYAGQPFPCLGEKKTCSHAAVQHAQHEDVNSITRG